MRRKQQSAFEDASGFESHLRVYLRVRGKPRGVSIDISLEVLFMGKKESDFQGSLIKELKKRYEGCMVLKNDPNYKQGIPDLTVLYRDRWAALECKRGEKEKHQPNQDYYVGKMNEMSYSAFIFPENKEQVLHELDNLFNR